MPCVTWQKSYFGKTIATVLNVPCHLRKFTVSRYSNPSPSLWTSDDLGDNSSTSFASSTARSGSPSSHYGNGSPRSNQTSSLVALRNNSPSGWTSDTPDDNSLAPFASLTSPSGSSSQQGKKRKVWQHWKSIIPELCQAEINSGRWE